MSDIKNKYTHVILGGGVAADHAARAIHKTDEDAEILIITDSERGPIYRPALTKDLWFQADATLDAQDLGTGESGAQIVTRTRATQIDPQTHTVTTDNGDVVSYNRLLLATGARARRFAVTYDEPRVVTLRGAEDYTHLRDLISTDTDVAVIGGGYIASEIAAALSNVGAKVGIYFPGDKLLDRMFPESITNHLSEVYGGHGIELHAHSRLTGIDTEGDRPIASFEDGSDISPDVLALGLGSEPAIELAEQAGLELADGGVVVDATLKTSADDIFAAGDIATFNDAILGRRRVEHIDNAEASGAVAGANMAGGSEVYDRTPLFYSDLFDDGYEAVGELSTKHSTREYWNDDHSAAVVYYLDANTVKGVLLWNTWDSVPAARKVLRKSAEGQLSPDDLAAQITPGG